MSKDAMQVTRQMKLQGMTLINLFDLEAQFADLHYSCIVNDFEHGLGERAGKVQEHLKAVQREIKRR